MYRNVKLTIAYDGTDFCGWQRQDKQRSVQGCLEEAIAKVLGRDVRLIAAGRTDAGVHAKAQVANFLTADPTPPEALQYRIAPELPKDIQIVSSVEVPCSFHARFSAHEKTYRYVIATVEQLHPIYRNYVAHVTYDLDVGAMQAASKLFLGTHDFSAYQKSQRPQTTEMPETNQTSVRTIRAISVERGADDAFLEITCTADGFLHNQMRILCGTLVSLGRGVLTEEDIRASLDQRKENAKIGPTLAACGLYLEDIAY